MNSCLYAGTLRHRRLSPTSHEFEYGLFMLYLDLDELPDVFDGRLLWSARRPAPAWFRRADYLGDAAVPLDEAVRSEALRLTGRRPRGPIRMLTHLRYLGYVMNPVSFYYCFAEDGTRVESILAEITNTPWGERHTYALTSGPDGDATGPEHVFGKSFHVSPFMEMEQSYAWRFGAPGERLTVHMESIAASGAAGPGEAASPTSARRVFDATLVLRREEISGVSLARALVRYPWMTARVATGIYWQAARLRMKGIPFHAHPRKRAA